MAWGWVNYGIIFFGWTIPLTFQAWKRFGIRCEHMMKAGICNCCSRLCLTVLNQWLSNSSWQTSALRLRKLKDLIKEMEEREAEREQKATEREERRWPPPVLIQHTCKIESSYFRITSKLQTGLFDHNWKSGPDLGVPELFTFYIHLVVR